MAFCSAWSVRWQLSRPSTTRIRQPTSSQCGIPEGLPLYPVVSIRLSRTTTAPTASRGQVERVATSWAMRMKYSSHEGRARLSAECSSEVSTSARLKGSIEPVSCVAESRHYEGGVVELRVDGGCVEVDVGVLAGQALHARHGGDGVEAGDPGRPLLLQLREGGREAPPRREHRVEDEHQVVLEVAGQIDVVLDGLGRNLVAEEPHEPDGGLREQSKCPVEHPEAGAQDRDQADRARDLLDLRLGKRGPYAGRTGWHVAGGFCDHDQGELLHGLPELRGGRPLVAQHGELVPAQRAVDDAEVLGLRLRRLRLTHTAGRWW